MAKPTFPDRLAADLASRLEQRFGSFPLIEGWGLTITALNPGLATLRIEATPRTTNPSGGFINGGVLASLADMASAVALCTAFDGQMPFVTADLAIRYLEPALGAVEAEAQVVRLSSRSAVISCELRCKGDTAALCTSHFTLKL
ncbi:MAG: PaaI family thioesterase [Firmicutes bacterium]|nr:PaaI family thioesterase [Bacillota bacterium]